MRQHPWLGRLLWNLMVWAVVLTIAFPLFWIVSTALRPETELFQRPPSLLPGTVTFEHFRRLVMDTPFPIYFRNSAIVALGTTVMVIIVGSLGAYSLSRFRYRGRGAIAKVVLLTYLMPSVVLFLPLYLIMAELGLVNSLFSLVLAYMTFALPFALWLLRSFIDAIPVETELAAMVDGASRMGAFFDVVLPQALPGIISTALFTFILAWNEYLYALVLTNRDTEKPLPPGVITMLTSSYNIEWALLMAASVLMSLPLILSFAFMQKHLTRGFGAGAVKG
ncbi:carbohydrate ABC transporter permease [Ferrovibrio sp.]|uniref:carbohydrate ABC transporter permease n=1 Tax=Ferrovibrio sp. TaxID=1917215 RepID=UPI003D26A8A3